METESPGYFMIFAGLFGGLGMFLLGMHLLTDGLKLAAGRALEDLLERWTSTRLRGLGAGMLITTLVQSSSAVTVASIGFVNAGILSLRNALWVIFGSNVGTTMNAWLVVALGFSFKIDAFALPFVGLGALLMLISRNVRLRALGGALAGFGVLFLGIDILKDTFSSFGESLDLQDYIIPGLLGWVILVLIGTLLTVLMQASGAAIAIVITAAHGGLISVEAACAVVIGTNIGTTSTAILSALGATANARRLAAGHVFFNLVTGLVALLILPLLIGFLGLLREWFDQPATPAVMIALFHSVFNVLGVLLMVPTSQWLLKQLGKRFGSRQEELERPLYLDANALSVPDLAVRALRLELGRMQAMVAESVSYAIHRPLDEVRVRQQREAVNTLAAAVMDYGRKLNGASLPPKLVDDLARAFRVLQYQENAVLASWQSTQVSAGLAADPAELAGAINAFYTAVDEVAGTADALAENFSVEQLQLRLREAEERYAHLKEALLVQGAATRLDLREMQERLRQASLLRRVAQQLAKGAEHLAALDAGEQAPPDKQVIEEGEVEREPVDAPRGESPQAPAEKPVEKLAEKTESEISSSSRMLVETEDPSPTPSPTPTPLSGG